MSTTVVAVPESPPAAPVVVAAPPSSPAVEEHKEIVVEPAPGPKKTFTLPTGDAVTVVAPPTPAPVDEKPKVVVVPAPVEEKPKVVIAPAEVTHEPAKTIVVAEPEKPVVVVAQKEKEFAPAAVAAPATAAPVTVVTKAAEPFPPLEEHKQVVAMVAEPAKQPVVVEKAVTVVSPPAAAVVEKPVTIVSSPAAAVPIVPVVQTVEQKTVAPVVVVPVEATKKPVEVVAVPAPAQTTIVTTREHHPAGNLGALTRKIAIFQSYVAQESTVLRFSDKYHHELRDASDHAVFHLHHRHHLIDEHGHLIACIHKSLIGGRWHAESEGHQMRLLTISRRRSSTMKISIKNTFTDRAEDLLYVGGRIYDGMDPKGQVAAMYDRDGVIQIAQGFDIAIVAIMAFVLKAWRHSETGVCFFCM